MVTVNSKITSFFIIISITLVAGCTSTGQAPLGTYQQSLPDYTQPETLQLTNQQKTIQSCPFECCTDQQPYQIKLCPTFYDCINNICEKRVCPFECCVDGGDYKAKLCQQDYSCIASICLPTDTDKDGLTDIEEKQLGTNFNSIDTDGDTLTDYQEVKSYLTNPNNKNTDNDRYNDNVDITPTYKNTALITVSKSNENGQYNLINVAKISALLIPIAADCIFAACSFSLSATAASAAPLMSMLDNTIYTSTADITIENRGTDYSNFVNYDISYFIGAKKLNTVSQSYGKVEATGQPIVVKYSHDIKLSEIASNFGEVISKILGKSQIIIEISNVQYEKF